MRYLIGALVVLAAACGGDPPAATPTATAVPTPSPTEAAALPLEGAFEDCIKPGQQKYADLGDEGRSLSMSGKDKYGEGVGYSAISCVLAAVDLPDHVLSRLNNTRALDGMQDAEWDGYEASWTYHPDDGVNLTIVQVDEP